MLILVIGLLMKKKYLNLMPAIKMLTNFPTQFCLRSISNGFSAREFREVSSTINVCDFSVDYNSIDKSYILNIHKYLMNKNNTKCSALLNKCLLYYYILVNL